MATCSVKRKSRIYNAKQAAQGAIFRDSYGYMFSQAQKAVFTLKNKLLPRLMFYLFDSLVRPILLYGNDVWGHPHKSSKTIENVSLVHTMCSKNKIHEQQCYCCRRERTNTIPSVYCHINVLCYMERLQHLKPDMLVKQVYLDLLRLHNCGHNTSVIELAQGYNLAIKNIPL